MRYWQCRCGYLTVEEDGTQPPARCVACPRCGSDLATRPALHRTPRAHRFTGIAPTIGGDPITRCRACGVRYAELHP